MLDIKGVSTYTGIIYVGEQQVKTMTQNFGESGRKSDSMGEYVSNPDLYYANLEECRKDEDEFINTMRQIEDENLSNNATSNSSLIK